MSVPSQPPLQATQKARLAQFPGGTATRSVDAHCHVLPGVDDGPRTLDDALTLCRMLARDGFTDVIATPHVLGRYDGYNWAPGVRRAVADLQAQLALLRIPLTVHPGSEVRVDERIPRLLQSDEILTLADTRRFLLLELPTALTVTAEAVLGHLSQTGLSIILAHAERYEMLRRDPAAAEAWVAAGAVLQVNADSFVGDAPPESRDAAFTWIEQGWLSLVATDAHSTGQRRPRMTEAIELLTREFGDEIARTLCLDNPERLLPALPAPPTVWDADPAPGP
jgi:protein-tyrosine phosphatase